MKIKSKKKKMNQVDKILRTLQEGEDEGRPKKPSKIVVYFFMIIIMGGMCFFIYNWWRCRQSRVLENENELDEFDFEEEDSGVGGEEAKFRQAGNYKTGDRAL